MKKILFVCDVNNFPVGAFRFLENLHKSEPFLLTGAFFHSANLDVTEPLKLLFEPDPMLAYTSTDIAAVESSIQTFKKKCGKSCIEYRVHEESKAFKTDDFTKETRFADLVVVSEELFFSHLLKEQPNSYMKHALQSSECPLLIIPENYETVLKLDIAYDGRKESVFALKQFCYLFPQYTGLPTTIDYWVHKTDGEIPDLEYIEEFASRHFTNLNFKQHFFDPKKYLEDWTSKNRNTIFVCGSYKRSFLSSLFKKSFIDDMIKYPSVLIFIAHN